PARRRVDRRITPGLRPVGVGEIVDPRDHVAGTLAVTRLAVRVVLRVERARQSSALVRPAAAVRQEVGGLGGAAGDVGTREAARTANQPGGVGAVVLLG